MKKNTEVEEPSKEKSSSDYRIKWTAIDGPGVRCDRYQPGSDAEKFMENLVVQQKVRTRIPREAKEPIDAFATIIQNGLRINVRKGVVVELPEQIDGIIQDSYYATEKAERPIQNNPFTGKPNEARMDLKSDSEINQLTR